MGTSVNQLVRDYLQQLAGKTIRTPLPLSSSAFRVPHRNIFVAVTRKLHGSSGDGAAVLYREDLQSGAVLAGVRVVNPFLR